jgi:hypothetical protein
MQGRMAHDLLFWPAQDFTFPLGMTGGIASGCTGTLDSQAERQHWHLSWLPQAQGLARGSLRTRRSLHFFSTESLFLLLWSNFQKKLQKAGVHLEKSWFFIRDTGQAGRCVFPKRSKQSLCCWVVAGRRGCTHFLSIRGEETRKSTLATIMCLKKLQCWWLLLSWFSVFSSF